MTAVKCSTWHTGMTTAMMRSSWGRLAWCQLHKLNYCGSSPRTESDCQQGSAFLIYTYSSHIADLYLKFSIKYSEGMYIYVLSPWNSWLRYYQHLAERQKKLLKRLETVTHCASTQCYSLTVNAFYQCAWSPVCMNCFLHETIMI